MALMTHAHTRPTTREYRDLTPAQQTAFDQQLDIANNTEHSTVYFDAMEKAAHIAGIHINASPGLAVCDCINHDTVCGCTLIFDTATDGIREVDGIEPGHNFSRLVCPTCAHDACHPAL
ncbi:hypothetical protein ACPCDX_28925 [Streptomyces koyangensis]|uniref:hypothetical protein n=1 Tax=Streptomyces koyangensis TaxID=188770 RepID=UPI003C2E6873